MRFLFLGNDEGTKYIDILIRDFNKYIDFIKEYPITLLIGEGFSTFGMRSGGDSGIIENPIKFWDIFFCFIIFTLLKIIKRSFFLVSKLERDFYISRILNFFYGNFFDSNYL